MSLDSKQKNPGAKLVDKQVCPQRLQQRPNGFGVWVFLRGFHWLGICSSKRISMPFGAILRCDSSEFVLCQPLLEPLMLHVRISMDRLLKHRIDTIQRQTWVFGRFIGLSKIIPKRGKRLHQNNKNLVCPKSVFRSLGTKVAAILLVDLGSLKLKEASHGVNSYSTLTVVGGHEKKNWKPSFFLKDFFFKAVLWFQISF